MYKKKSVLSFSHDVKDNVLVQSQYLLFANIAQAEQGKPLATQISQALG